MEREIEVVQRVDPGLALLGQPAFDLAFTASAMWVDSVGVCLFHGSRGEAAGTDAASFRNPGS